MFGEKTMEASSITGTGAYQLGTPVGAYNSWRSQFVTASVVFYYAQRSDGTIWEAGYGVLTYGAPDTISRTLIASSTGSLISWAVADAPIYVFSAPSATALAAMIKGGMATARPAWAQAGYGWLDSTSGIATRLIQKFYNGTSDFEVGRFEAVDGIWVQSPRRPFTAKGAANYVVVANDIARRFSFDTTAAALTLTLPAGSSVGVGFQVSAVGLAAANGIVVTPNGTDAVDWGAGGAALTVPGRTPFDIYWDGTQWRTNYVVATAAPAFAGVRQTVASGPVDTGGLPTFLPASSASLTLSEQNISASYPQVLSAANGWNATTGEPVDAVGYSSAAQSWNLPANSTVYLYKTIGANGVMTPGQTTLAPIYQWGGTPSTVNGQFTFNIAEMRGYMGNGATAPQANVVFVGEAVTGASTVSSTVAYAYNGLYESGWTATLPGAATYTNANHNIGVAPRYAAMIIECTTADQGWPVGDQAVVNLMTVYASSYDVPVSIATNTKSIGLQTGSGGGVEALTRTSGVVNSLTLASWKFKFMARRDW